MAGGVGSGFGVVVVVFVVVFVVVVVVVVGVTTGRGARSQTLSERKILADNRGGKFLRFI